MIHFSRLQVFNLSSKIGLVKYGNIVKLSLKLWTMLLTMATLVSPCMKVSVEIETSLRVILQISSYCFKGLTLCDILVSWKRSSSIAFLLCVWSYKAPTATGGEEETWKRKKQTVWERIKITCQLLIQSLNTCHISLRPLLLLVSKPHVSRKKTYI